jgi:uncharacterized protein with GYD domain
LKTHASRVLAVPVVVVLVLAVATAPAQATLEVSSNSTDGLIVRDLNDLGDIVLIRSGTRNGDPVYFVENNNSLDFFKFDLKQGCSQGDTGNVAVCNLLRGKLNLAMAGGRDDVRVSPLISSSVTTASVNLGLGDDYYEGIAGADDVFGASGADDIRTGSGNDSVRLSSDGVDEVRSGAGNDSIEFLFQEVFTFGGSDFIDAGDGDDSIVKAGLALELNDVRAGAGNDTVTITGSSEDQVSGGTGNDKLTAGPNKDSVSGGNGDDTIDSGTGDDTVNGGAGQDNITTQGGDDLVISKESDNEAFSFKDIVKCGFGSDDVIADLMDEVDAVSGKTGGTCEEVDRSPIRETPHVRILAKTLRVGASGGVRVVLRCPRGVRRLGCNGTLQLGIARTRGGSGKASRSDKVRYAIRAGRRRGVALQLTGADVRRLRRNERRGATTRGVLVSVEKGRLGPKTTLRNPLLKLR